MALKNLDKVIGLLQQGGDQGDIVSDVEITEDMKKNFEVQDNREGNEGSGENPNRGFSVAPNNPNEPLTGEQSKMLMENLSDPGNRVTGMMSGKINPGVPNAGDDLAEFQGTAIEGKTAKGVPEPEEISGLGKAFKNFADILETPGARQFLGRMGIAFSEGREGSMGTVLGKAGLQDVQGETQKRLTEGLLAGKSIDEIDLGGAQPSSETITQARESALSERKFEENKGQFDTKTALEGARIGMDKRRLDLMERELGLKKGELAIDKLKTLGEMYEDSRPDDVSASAYGMAQKMAASTFLDVAKESFRNEQGQLAEVSEIMNTLSTQNVGIDPTKIRSRLPDNLKQEFDNYVARVSKSIARTGSQPTESGAFDVPTSLQGAIQSGVVGENVTTIPATSEGKAKRNELPDGALFKVKGRPGLYIKQGQGQRRVGE